VQSGAVNLVGLRVEGAYLVELDPSEDERGFFARLWGREEFAELGLNPELAQVSVSRSTRAGTLRGLHFQRSPHEEAKLVRCTRGVIFDVVVDLRVDSPTRGTWSGAELDAVRGSALYVPEGCAHGFQTLTNDADVLYLISHPYVPEAADGVRWDDPAFAIDWPEAASRTISERDQAWADFHFGTPPRGGTS
jgi:dTDP-4-dehydrorhamnose 3,5-epimerase